MLADLDDFKAVNDSLGHQLGDEFLRRVAERMSAAVPPEATVARLGGDEFAILLPHADLAAGKALACAIVNRSRSRWSSSPSRWTSARASASPCSPPTATTR
jgi:diguanylate cyclase (GGDEF)-like protein